MGNKIKTIYKFKKWVIKNLFFIKKINFKKKKGKFLNQENILLISKSFLKSIKKSIGLVLFIFLLEYILKFVIRNIDWPFIVSIKNICNIKIEWFSQFLICGIGVAGVFLALYYSNISTIYSLEYSNTNDRIRRLFENEIQNNSSLKKINDYIIQASLILFFMMIGISIWYIFVIYMVIKTINIVINFIIRGHIIYEFSNIYNILLNRKKELLFYIECIANKKYNDVYFQKMHIKETVKILKDMTIVNDYILKNDNSEKNDKVLDFAINNILIIIYYLSKKNYILFNSLWYKRKKVYKKWYDAPFYEKKLALYTGTELSYNYVLDFDWLESSILEINNKSIKYIISNLGIKEIACYIRKLIESMPYWIAYGNIDLIYNHFEKIVDEAIDKIIKNNFDNKNDIMLFIDVINCMFIDYITFVREYIEKININDWKIFLESSYNYSDKELQKINSKILNNSEFYNIYKALKNEKYIEKRLITPEWYIYQSIAKFYVNEINKMLNVIELIYNKNLRLGEKLIESESYVYSAAFIVKENEIYDKTHYMLNVCSDKFKLLEKNNIEKKDNFPKIYIEKIINDIDKKHFEKVPELWKKLCAYFVLKNDENERDFFGFFYDNLCEYIFQTILHFDFDKFSNSFENIVDLAILSEASISNELKKNNKYNNYLKFEFQTYALNEMFNLSGYAIIVGEILSDCRWKKKIDEILKDRLKKDNEAKKWCDIIEVLNDCNRPYLNIDVADKEKRFNAVISKSNKLKFVQEGNFKYKKISNTINLEKITYDELSGLSVDMREIFAIACLNQYLSDGDKYRSRFLKIEEWEEMKNEE